MYSYGNYSILPKPGYVCNHLGPIKNTNVNILYLDSNSHMVGVWWGLQESVFGFDVIDPRTDIWKSFTVTQKTYH